MDEQQDFDDACWAQQHFDERRQREDEAIARCRTYSTESQAEYAHFLRETIEFWNRISSTR